MNLNERFWFLVGPVVFSLVMAASSPIIHVYFVSQVSPRVIAAANLLGTGFAAVVNYSVRVERLKDLYRRYFKVIVLVDVLLFASVSALGVEYPEARFLGFSFINAVSTCLWVMVMRNVVNRVIVDGDARTDFEALERSTCLSASFVGGVLAVVFVEVPVEYCVLAQCLGNAFMGVTDLHAFSLLKRAYRGEG